MIALDRAWLAEHPLPGFDGVTDKNGRGRVVIVGGSRFVPGALRLTAEAALRAGCGKVQMATIAEAAIPLGIAVPEAAVIALPAGGDGEISADAAPMIIDAMDAADCVVIGPGMSDSPDRIALLKRLLQHPRDDLTVLLDAAAIPACAACSDVVRRLDGRMLLTPNHGEMAGLCDVPIEAIAANSQSFAERQASELGACIALKGPETIIASPMAPTALYGGGGVGLATGGSGDVLAGIAAGLVSRGVPLHEAAAWAVWVHGEAGRLAAEARGHTGYLARDLGGFISTLVSQGPEAPA